jgi:hypothetical protein
MQHFDLMDPEELFLVMQKVLLIDLIIEIGLAGGNVKKFESITDDLWAVFEVTFKTSNICQFWQRSSNFAGFPLPA